MYFALNHSNERGVKQVPVVAYMFQYIKKYNLKVDNNTSFTPVVKVQLVNAICGKKNVQKVLGSIEKEE